MDWSQTLEWPVFLFVLLQKLIQDILSGSTAKITESPCALLACYGY